VASDLEAIGRIIRSVKVLEKKYRRLTGRPLGITGEVAEYEASRILGLQLMPAREAGYDAVRTRKHRIEKIQIKGRCILSDKPGQRLGRLDLRKQWHFAVLVLLDGNLEPISIYEAPRRKLAKALLLPGSKARNDRGALSVNKFKSLGRLVWSSE